MPLCFAFYPIRARIQNCFKERSSDLKTPTDASPPRDSLAQIYIYLPKLELVLDGDVEL